MLHSLTNQLALGDLLFLYPTRWDYRQPLHLLALNSFAVGSEVHGALSCGYG